MTAMRATRLVRRTGFGAATLLALSSSALAQTGPAPAPVDPATPGAPPADAPPAPGEQPLPPPAEPTSPAEPAPMAASPLVEESPPPPPPTYDEPPDDDGGRDRSAGPFSKGSVRLTLLVGWGSTITEEYLILGGGLGYFLVDGLEVGVDYEAWLFAQPVMHRVSPETKYIFHMVPVIKPYVGVFYRHTFVTQDYEDFDHVGARGGIFYVPKNGRMFVGGGAIYERLLDCEDNAILDCDEVYPEIFFGVSI